MPKLNNVSPPAWGALELTPFALNFAFTPFREAFFQEGPNHRLLAEANNRKLPVFPTLPALFNGNNLLGTYEPGTRNAALSSTSATRGRVWVTSKKPWLRSGFLPRGPKTVTVAGAAIWGGSLVAPAQAIDAAWPEFDTGGWEVAVLGTSDDPYWGLPVKEVDISEVGLQGDFQGYFGELVLCRIGRADLTIVPFDVHPEGSDNDEPPPDDPDPDPGETVHAQKRYTVPVDHASARASITSVADEGGFARVTATTTDGLMEEELVRITGTANYDGDYAVLDVTATEFTLADPDSLAPVAFVDDDTGGWRRATSHRLVWVSRPTVLADSGPAFYAQVESNYKRFRQVVVTGSLSDFEITETDPTTSEWDIQNLYEAIRQVELMFTAADAASLYTGLDSVHLSVPWLPFETFDQRAAEALASWLQSNLNS